MSKESNDYKRSNAMESRSHALTDRASNIKCEKNGCTSESIMLGNKLNTDAQMNEPIGNEQKNR